MNTQDKWKAARGDIRAHLAELAGDPDALAALIGRISAAATELEGIAAAGELRQLVDELVSDASSDEAIGLTEFSSEDDVERASKRIRDKVEAVILRVDRVVADVAADERNFRIANSRGLRAWIGGAKVYDHAELRDAADAIDRGQYVDALDILSEQMSAGDAGESLAVVECVQSIHDELRARVGR